MARSKIPRLISGVSSRTQIDALGNKKFILEITKTQKGSHEGQGNQKIHSQLNVGSGKGDQKSKKKKRSRPTSSRIAHHKPFQLTFNNEKDSQVETIRGGQSSNRGDDHSEKATLNNNNSPEHNYWSPVSNQAVSHPNLAKKSHPLIQSFSNFSATGLKLHKLDPHSAVVGPDRATSAKTSKRSPLNSRSE